MEFFVGGVLAGLSFLAISLHRTFNQVPIKELRRRARSGDELAVALYRAAAYEHSLGFFLWGLVGLTCAAFFVFVARTAPVWFALAASGALIWVGFIWLTTRRATAIGEKTAAVCAPVLAYVLTTLHPILDFVVRQIQSRLPRAEHTRLYEKADLLDLLDMQEKQSDNRIERAELEIVRGALLFGDRLVGDTMTPRRMVKMACANDDLGPVLMSELHDSGYSRFPVFNGQKDNVIGTLYLRDLVNVKTGGKVKDMMSPKVLYLHEDQSLHDALRAILKTRHHLYVVVNSFEEYVGIITMEDVMEQIMGKPIMDEFDEYEDPRTVTKRLAGKEHSQHTAKEKPTKKTKTPSPGIDGKDPTSAE